MLTVSAQQKEDLAADSTPPGLFRVKAKPVYRGKYPNFMTHSLCERGIFVRSYLLN